MNNNVNITVILLNMMMNIIIIFDFFLIQYIMAFFMPTHLGSRFFFLASFWYFLFIETTIMFDIFFNRTECR